MILFITKIIIFKMVFKLYTLNVNNSTLLGGLLDFLIRDKPDLVCLQEVCQLTEELDTLVSRYGYRAVSSLMDNNLGIATVYRDSLPVLEVLPLEPGRLQLIRLQGDLNILNLYAPSGNNNIQQRNIFYGETVLRNLRLRGNLPILIGDFNCVLDRSDTMENFNAKKCAPLADLINLFSYSDALRVLHPRKLGMWTFSRPGISASRLDRVYLPDSLRDQLTSVEHYATISDHKLVEVVLTSNFPVQGPRVQSPYWKFNTSVLLDQDFNENFLRLWNNCLLLQGDFINISEWWEKCFKFNLRLFLQKFSSVRFRGRRDTKQYLFYLLDYALEDEDWEQVTYLRSRLKTMIQEDLYGFVIRSRASEHAECEQGSLYHVSKEVKKGKVASLTKLNVNSLGGVQETEDRQVIEDEIMSFYSALFNGHHRTDPDMVRSVQEQEDFLQEIRSNPGSHRIPPVNVPAREPFNTGSSFVPDISLMEPFLENLSQLQDCDKIQLDSPFSLEELDAALETCSSNKSPGLDGIPYEVYKRTKNIISPTILQVFQESLDSGILPSSMRQGVTRLLNKVQGVPKVTDLRPITLLSCDYKLMTKIMVKRLTRVLPEVLTSNQLCSNAPKNILFGASNLLSSIDYVNINNLSAYVISFDIFKAYDKTSINFITTVMRGMNFGERFISWVVACHNSISTQFILGSDLSLFLQVLISLRQGDPLAMPLFLINMEPFLQFIKSRIKGLTVGTVKQGEEGFVDDVNAISSDLQDMLTLNKAFLQFEAISGTVLNRTSKSKIMGIGGWTRRDRWPLTWIKTEPSLRIFGIQFHPTITETIQVSWETCRMGFSKCLRSWAARSLPTLMQRVQVIQSFALSKLWYLGQVLPIPSKMVEDLEKEIRSFLWIGRLEKLTYEELFNSVDQGGLGLTSVAAKCDALFATQLCRLMAHQGPYREHLRYWVGVNLRDHLPDMVRGPNAQVLTPYFKKTVSLLKEALSSGTVNIESLESTKAKLLYKEFMSTPPPPKVTSVPVMRWQLIFSRLSNEVICPEGRDLLFSIVHNVYKTKSRLFRMNKHPTGNCTLCRGELEDCVHLFAQCVTSRPCWIYIKNLIINIFPDVFLMDDMLLLFLDFPQGEQDTEILFIVSHFVIFIHRARFSGEKPSILKLRGFLRERSLVYKNGRFPRLNLQYLQ